MRKPKTPAQSLTDNHMTQVSALWPRTVMHWDTKFNGRSVPWAYIKQALSALDRFDIEAARSCLMRPVTTGLIGGPDVTGIIGNAPGRSVEAGRFVSWEIKAGADRQREEQVKCQQAIERHGGLYILVESVDQGIADLMKYAGPGEKK